MRRPGIEAAMGEDLLSDCGGTNLGERWEQGTILAEVWSTAMSG